MSEREAESEWVIVPFEQSAREHDARMRRACAPKKVERRLEVVNWEGFTLVLLISHSYLLPSRGHDRNVRLLREAEKRYPGRLRIVYANFQERKIPKPAGLDQVPAFWLYRAGKLLGEYLPWGRRGVGADFWDWLQGLIEPRSTTGERIR